MSDLVGVSLTVLLLAINAFFVGAEFALISARRDRLETLISQGNRRARVVLDATEHLSLMLAAAQLGITIASLLLGKVSEPAIAHLLDRPFQAIGVPESLQSPLSFAIALLLVTILHIILGEMVPKNIALAGPETMAMWLVPAHMVFFKLTKPFLLALNWVARMTLRLFGIEQKDELDSAVNSVELASMISESRQEGLLDAEEHARLSKALRTSKRRLDEVLIPYDKVVTLPYRDSGPTVGDLEDAVAETGFSRFPVCTSTGTYVGYVHVKDMLDQMLQPNTGRDTVIDAEDIRPLLNVNPDGAMDETLRLLRRQQAHMAQVHRGVKLLGIITLEDLIEEYVGQVHDWTHDDA
ncbi:hemolysin family protein [Corynebacterium ulceribovis]|uniref:hemolysin family protein n=1 Tax=Corynebacterium ulceribovis TaxID=487732 RepID=UPI00036C28A3|nr:hemolysin family protein [Corynebacterium ulceribovis]